MTGLAGTVRALRHTVGRNGRAIVDVDTLDLPAGRMTVVTGPSGSGKSTLLHLVCGLLAPTPGAVRWGEVDIGRLGEAGRDRWRRAHAGFVFQDFHLVDELSPVDNVLVAGWFDRLSTASFRPRAVRLLDELGVPSGRSRASLLSRGEKQRLAIVRALIFDPPVVFADEPTASLDAVAGERVVETLAALARRDGRTLVVATHDPALIAAADARLAMDHGRVVTASEREAA